MRLTIDKYRQGYRDIVSLAIPIIIGQLGFTCVAMLSMLLQRIPKIGKYIIG